MNELTGIKGIGLTTQKALAELKIYSLKDLITYYPFRHNVIEKTDIDSAEDNDNIVIDGLCESLPTIFYFSRVKNKMSFRFNIGNRVVNVSIFNRNFLKDKIKIGTSLTVIGKFDKKKNTIVASDLKFGLITKTIIEPVYHSSYKMSSQKIHRLILPLLNNFEASEIIPDYLNGKYSFIEKKEAIKIIHNPESKELLNKAINKLKYEELFTYLFKVNALKLNRKNDNGLERKVEFSEIEDFIGNLPFELTEDQIKSVKDIYADLISNNRMNRLLQGDVGSGKTIVAFISIYINYLSGYQSALMAPTEILAKQHYKAACNILKNLKIILLTGSTKAKEKKEIYQKLKDGEIDLVIGTHALISNGVEYKNLGLVITDEQHRFGVNQRASLKNKGITPDTLYMSATPIPRTYALTLYGDMDISSIKTMPSGRKEIKTYLKTNKEIKDVLYMMLDEIKKGHQIYVVAPLIEESEKIDLENVNELTDKMNKAFSKVCNIGTLHGKMTNSEKDEIMNQFKNNKIQILISTTVVEVGVDVPNATMIVIFDSYRFGLSALHQLRGRVGRNDLDSYCILVSDRETKRLDILTKTNDGFKISEEDFMLRGGGDLFGVNQSGDMVFKVVDLKSDYKLLIEIQKDITDLIQNHKESYEKLMSKMKKVNRLD